MFVYCSVARMPKWKSGLRRTVFFTLATLLTVSIAIRYGNTLFILAESDTPSESHGTTSNGSLSNGKRLPTTGSNFVTYSYLGSTLGRNSVHNKVRDIVLEAYAAMAVEYPDLRFVLGETGWPGGGSFRPHKSHSNGLSVDFMVPVRDENGRPTSLPTSIFNKFGYGIEFDSSGKADSLTIDFDAMALHLTQLKQATQNHGLNIELVIFDPTLQSKLFATNAGRALPSILRFSTSPSWVRHDEHYHVDFAF